jgi:hypothetical protein
MVSWIIASFTDYFVCQSYYLFFFNKERFPQLYVKVSVGEELFCGYRISHSLPLPCPAT